MGINLHQAGESDAVHRNREDQADALAQSELMSKLSRTLVKTRFGHIHVIHNAFYDPSLTPVICLHMSGHSGRSFAPLIKHMHENRRYIAIDYPGCGDSDAPPSGPNLSIEDYAEIAWDVVAGLQLKSVNLFGHHTGAKVAVAMAAQRPELVNKIILAATSISNSSANGMTAKTAPVMNKQYLGQLMDQVDRLESPSITQNVRAGLIKEALKAGQHFYAPQNAAQLYNNNYAAALLSLSHNVTVINLNDEFRTKTPRIMEYLSNGELVERMDWGHGFLETMTADVAVFIERVVTVASHNGRADMPKVKPEGSTPHCSGLSEYFSENGQHLNVAKAKELKSPQLSPLNIYYLARGHGYLFSYNQVGKRQISQILVESKLFFIERGDHFRALSESKLIALDDSRFRSVFEESPSRIAEVFDELKKSATELKYVSTLLGSSTARQSVSGFVLYLADKYQVDENEQFDTELTRFEMSEFLGLTFETVSRQLSALKKLGIIKVNGSQLTICDKPMLKAESSLS